MLETADGREDVFLRVFDRFVTLGRECKDRQLLAVRTQMEEFVKC